MAKGMITNVRCVECGSLMVVRQNKRTGNLFLACENWDCDHTRSIPEDLVMKDQGQMTLFDIMGGDDAQ